MGDGTSDIWRSGQLSSRFASAVGPELLVRVDKGENSAIIEIAESLIGEARKIKMRFARPLAANVSLKQQRFFDSVYRKNGKAHAQR